MGCLNGISFIIRRIIKAVISENGSLSIFKFGTLIWVIIWPSSLIAVTYGQKYSLIMNIALLLSFVIFILQPISIVGVIMAIINLKRHKKVRGNVLGLILNLIGVLVFVVMYYLVLSGKVAEM